MKTTIKNSLLGLALALILASCQDVVRPSSRVTVQERNVTEFEGIEIPKSVNFTTPSFVTIILAGCFHSIILPGGMLFAL